MRLRLTAAIVKGPFPVVDGSPAAAWPEVRTNIAALISTRSDMEFKIGRTNDAEERDRDHDSNELVVVYRTKAIDEVKIMEEAAIKEFGYFPGCRNQAADSRGDIGPGTQYIYVAFWEK